METGRIRKANDGRLHGTMMVEMFKRGWLRRNRIYSDEGFTVDIAGRFAIIYHEGKRTMSVAAEMLTDGFAISPSSVGHWDDDP